MEKLEEREEEERGTEKEKGEGPMRIAMFYVRPE